MTVESLVKNAPDRFDFIFVECSGMAEPGALAKVFWVFNRVTTNSH
jgi:G3E family GTPase